MKDRLILMGMKFAYSNMMLQYRAVQTGGRTKWAKANGGKRWQGKKWYARMGMVEYTIKRGGKRIPIFRGGPIYMLSGYATNTIGHNKKWTKILRRTAFKYAVKFLIPRAISVLKKTKLASLLEQLLHLMDLYKAGKNLGFSKFAEKRDVSLLRRLMRRTE